MRIDLGVAVSREMLQCREHAVLLQAVHVCLHQLRHGARVLAERADIDDRIERIVVDVGVGREVDVDPDGAAFDGGDAADRVGVALIAGRAGGHDHRKRRRADDAHPRAPLEIGGDQ